MKQYEKPSLELISYEEDIVRTSVTTGENELPGDNLLSFGENQ